MKKVNDDAKKIDKKNAALTEGELENAAGGTGALYRSRWACAECGAHGTWGCESRLRDYEQNFHYQQTGHFQFKTEGRYFEGPYDPYED